jgi:hypothetical protein
MVVTLTLWRRRRRRSTIMVARGTASVVGITVISIRRASSHGVSSPLCHPRRIVVDASSSSSPDHGGGLFADE